MRETLPEKSTDKVLPPLLPFPIRQPEKLDLLSTCYPILALKCHYTNGGRENNRWRLDSFDCKRPLSNFNNREISHLLPSTSFLFSVIIKQVAAFAPLSTIKHDARTSVLQMAEGSSVPGPPYSGPSSKPILDSVKFPSDMKRLNMRELKQVCVMRVIFNVGTFFPISH